MHAILPCPPSQAVSSEEVDRFRQVALIHDEARFRQMLDELVSSKASNENLRKLTPDEREAMLARMRALPEFQPVERYKPSQTQLQQGRILTLTEFNKPHNLPLLEFAHLAGMSRQHIYKLIKARKLLAITASGRGIRIPDWQLDPIKARLTREVLIKSGTVDHWTLYRELSMGDERFNGKAPIDMVTLRNIDKVVIGVLDNLQIQV
ncbi:MAG: integrase [Gammaproteobacteria bacterium]